MPEQPARSFYGGDAPLGNQGGEITAGHYDGPEAHVEAPWKCPACAKENEGPLKFGCVHCGSGKPGTHVGVQQPPPPAPATETVRNVASAIGVYPTAEAWAEAHPTASLAEAFAAGYLAAMQLTMRAAPPVTADVEALAPAGKPRRTIVAALEIFRDQILPVSAEEIANGEWCSVAEIEQLIGQLQAEEDEG